MVLTRPETLSPAAPKLGLCGHNDVKFLSCMVRAYWGMVSIRHSYGVQ